MGAPIPQRNEEEILAAMHGQESDDDSAGGDKIALGGRTYIIHPLKGRANSRWFRKQVGPIIESLEGIAPLAMLIANKEEGANIRLEEEHVTSIVGLFKQLGGPQFDTLLDTVYRWSPEINNDKWYLEGYVINEEGLPLDSSGEEVSIGGNGEPNGDPELSGEGATDEEFLKAFLIIMRMVYGPFVETLGLKLTKRTEEET